MNQPSKPMVWGSVDHTRWLQTFPSRRSTPATFARIVLTDSAEMVLRGGRPVGLEVKTRVRTTFIPVEQLDDYVEASRVMPQLPPLERAASEFKRVAAQLAAAEETRGR